MTAGDAQTLQAPVQKHSEAALLYMRLSKKLVMLCIVNECIWIEKNAKNLMIFG